MAKTLEYHEYGELDGYSRGSWQLSKPSGNDELEWEVQLDLTDAWGRFYERTRALFQYKHEALRYIRAMGGFSNDD